MKRSTPLLVSEFSKEEEAETFNYMKDEKGDKDQQFSFS